MALNQAQIESLLPGYRLNRFLGRGGFGEVWEALAPGEISIAIKSMRLEHSLSEDAQRELDILRSVRHAHLLDVHFAHVVDVCTVHEVETYLLMGMTLCERDLMSRFKICRDQGHIGIPVVELLELMEETAEALDYLHDRGVVHRDIKPHNIFLVGGTVKVADFGLAKMLDQTVSTQSGNKYTPAYVAPEVIQGSATKASDQYSLAISYCQLKTGDLPIQAQNVVALLFAHVNQSPDLSRLSPGERDVLQRALAKSPEQRWPSCTDFIKSLKNSHAAHRSGSPAALSTISQSMNFESVIPPVHAQNSIPREFVSQPTRQEKLNSVDDTHRPISHADTERLDHTQDNNRRLLKCPHCGGSQFIRFLGLQGIRHYLVTLGASLFFILPGIFYYRKWRRPLFQCKDCKTVFRPEDASGSPPQIRLSKPVLIPAIGFCLVLGVALYYGWMLRDPELPFILIGGFLVASGVWLWLRSSDADDTGSWIDSNRRKLFLAIGFCLLLDLSIYLTLMFLGSLGLNR